MAKRAKGATTKSTAPRAAARGVRSTAGAKDARSYDHPEATNVLRPDVGTQAQFRKKKPPQRYRYDSSLSPALEWDGQNPAREQGEALIRQILDAETVEQAKAAAEQLKALSRPFLNWAGKAERLSFDVPTLPLFVHERLSTKAILETLKGHKRDRQLSLLDLFNDPQHPIHDQVLRAYEYPDKWVNRLILGDSLVVMNSLLHYESLGGQVQMIYMDPPYGVRFGSNFQPFVRKRDVKHNDDQHMTREPEMVKAYRDTWELGLHSYIAYMRDRLLMTRELLSPSGSIFVQIGDDNSHHLREIMDEVFGAENFAAQIVFRKTTGKGSSLLDNTYDSIIWYSRDRERTKYRPLFAPRLVADDENLRLLLLPDGKRRRMTPEEATGSEPLPPGSRPFRPNPLTNQRPAQGADLRSYTFAGRSFTPGSGTFRTDLNGMRRLESAGRLMAVGNTLAFVRYLDDFPYKPRNDIWHDTRQSGFGEAKAYAVQTAPRVIERCMLMTTDPGDLVLDPTCGSGTTAFVAEQWGRRWITIDTSRVPLALARQRLLTATFPYYQLKDESRGPAGGFVYVRKQNSKGEEAGGIVPHVTLKSIANDEPADEEVLVDRPETESKITRVTGAFCVEATIPTPVDWEGDGIEDSGVSSEPYGSFVDRMIEVLRRSPVLHVGGGKTVSLRNVRAPAKTLSLSAEALVENGAASGAATRAAATPEGDGFVAEPGRPDKYKGDGKVVAIVFGPENGAVSEKLVYEAAREAYAKSYTHLYVIGFAIQPNARELVDKCEAVVGIPATYVQATPDLMMADLLKTTRASQIFSVCGLPEVKVRSRQSAVGSKTKDYEVELVGLDVFDPATMEAVPYKGDDVPAWLLDTDYNGLCFHVSQAFFPRTAAWDDLKRALKGEYEDSLWEHLAGSVSAPFEAGEHGQIAVKVIDDRGNELMVVKHLKDAE